MAACRRQARIIAIDQACRGQRSKERTRLEANREPLTLWRTEHGPCPGFGPAERDSGRAVQAAEYELAVCGGHRREGAASFAVAAPDTLDERGIGSPLAIEDDEHMAR